MAEAVDVQRLKSSLECSICLEQYNNPKVLKCSHQFCKECLESYITFRPNGSAVIVCPMRCTAKTVISSNQTVNDLAATYDFKNILEAMKMEDGRLASQIPTCNYVKSCKKDISVYCCEMMMCNACYLNHVKTDGQHQRRTILSFNKRECKFNVICNEHVSECTHLCVDDKFLCIYCIHRNQDHENHAKNTIETEVELIKQALLNGSHNRKSSLEYLKATEQNMIVIKRKLDDLLLRRKEECLSRYSDFLNKGEETLRRKFQSICDEHMKQYPRDAADPTGYCQQMLGRKNIELVIEKEAILKTICNRGENKLFLNSVTVSVSDNFDFRSEHPLGDLHITVDEDALLNDLPVSTLNDNIKTENKRRNITQNPKFIQPNSADRKIATSTTDSAKFNIGKSSVKSLKNTSESKIISSPSMVRAYFDIKIDKTSAGRIVMNLYDDAVPKTCRNFIQLCTHNQGFGYKGSKFHWIKPGVGCVGGDITKGDGSGGKSIYGEKFECENFIKKHDDKGIVSMTRCGENFTSSIFCISTKAAPECDGKFVVFGKVTDETYSVVQKMVSVGGLAEKITGRSGKPRKDIVIASCGVL